MTDASALVPLNAINAKKHAPDSLFEKLSVIARPRPAPLAGVSYDTPHSRLGRLPVDFEAGALHLCCAVKNADSATELDRSGRDLTLFRLLALRLQRDLHKPPNGFSAAGNIGLLAAPIVDLL